MIASLSLYMFFLSTRSLYLISLDILLMTALAPMFESLHFT